MPSAHSVETCPAGTGLQGSPSASGAGPVPLHAVSTTAQIPNAMPSAPLRTVPSMRHLAAAAPVGAGKTSGLAAG
jgi:hypothetical protein